MSPSSGGQSSGPAWMACPTQGGMKMDAKDLLKAGLFSEAVLLGGEVLFVSLFLILVAALMRA